jgi:hypothetical protein
VAASLAIAIFGVAMLHAFNSALDRRLEGLGVPPESRLQLNDDRVKLAALEPPSTLSPETATGVRRTIADSFIVGFRRLLMFAAALAILGALVAWVAVENRLQRQSGELMPP